MRRALISVLIIQSVLLSFASVTFASAIHFDCELLLTHLLKGQVVTYGNVKVTTLNMGGVDGYAKTETSVLLKAVKRMGLAPDEVLFYGFNGAHLYTVLKNGAEHNDQNFLPEIFSADDLLFSENEDVGFKYSVFSQVTIYKSKAIAVYNKSLLLKTSDDPDTMLSGGIFMDAENKQKALLAVFILNYYQGRGYL